MAKMAIVVVGANSAESDIIVAQQIMNDLNSRYIKIKIKKDNEVNMIDSLLKDIICVGGPKVNTVSAKYSTIVTGPRIEIEGNSVFIRDSFGNTCFLNDWNRHVGIISSGAKTIFSRVYIIAGLDRYGTIGAGKIFSTNMQNVSGRVVVPFEAITTADSDGNPTGYTDKCGGKFISV